MDSLISHLEHSSRLLCSFGIKLILFFGILKIKVYLTRLNKFWRVGFTSICSQKFREWVSKDDEFETGSTAVWVSGRLESKSFLDWFGAIILKRHRKVRSSYNPQYKTLTPSCSIITIKALKATSRWTILPALFWENAIHAALLAPLVLISLAILETSSSPKPASHHHTIVICFIIFDLSHLFDKFALYLYLWNMLMWGNNPANMLKKPFF